MQKKITRTTSPRIPDKTLSTPWSSSLDSDIDVMLLQSPIIRRKSTLTLDISTCIWLVEDHPWDWLASRDVRSRPSQLSLSIKAIVHLATIDHGTRVTSHSPGWSTGQTLRPLWPLEPATSQEDVRERNKINTGIEACALPQGWLMPPSQPVNFH